MTLERNLNRSERERLARMRGSWRADRPSDVEVERARTRWLNHANVSPSRRRPEALLVAAVVFGAAGALAATGAVTWPKTSSDRLVAPLSLSAHPTAQARSAPARVAAPRTSARVPDAAAEPPDAAVKPPDAAVKPPESAVKSESVTLSKRPLVAASPAQPSADVPMSAETETEPTNAAAAQGAWQRAADALRQGDDHRATQALQELSSSSDPYTRDTAALAKAQLDAAAGRWELALPILHRLAAQGSTPLLRRRAGEVLAQGPRPQ